jgi:hypothetical protein
MEKTKMSSIIVQNPIYKEFADFALQDQIRTSSVTNDVRHIAFVGSHRVGKTTLAKKLSEVAEIPFIDLAVSENSVWNIFDPHANVTFAERIVLQKCILQDMEAKLKQVDKGKSYITDRSPIDVIAYLLCNIDSTTSQLFDEEVNTFIVNCQSLALEYFNYFFVVQPGIVFEKEVKKDGKVYNSRAYQEALTNCVIGQLHRLLNVFNLFSCGQGDIEFKVVPSSALFTQDRVKWVMNQINAMHH